MTALDEVVRLLDVDNTPLDNDRIEADLRDHLERIGELVIYDLPAFLGVAEVCHAE